MILLGAELIESWQPVLLGFAGILLFSSYKLLSGKSDNEDEDLEQNAIVKLCRSALSTLAHVGLTDQGSLVSVIVEPLIVLDMISPASAGDYNRK